MSQQSTATETVEVSQAFDAWARALKTLDPEQVAGLYDRDAVLIPTVSNRIRSTPNAIVDYFVRFLAKAPEARLHESSIRILGDIAIHSGIYLFSLTKEAGTADVPARFTFVYRRKGGKWVIIEHHSSFMPELGAY